MAIADTGRHLTLCAAVAALLACGGSSPENVGGAGSSGGGSGGGGGSLLTTTSGATGELCGNGLDDNGDGQIDEVCLCTVGAVQPCYSGDPSMAGKGACTYGTQTCVMATSGEFTGNHFGPCVGVGAPSVEICNGVDDDCDGLVDEVDCACTPGGAIACYSGPASTAGIGVCQQGSQTCLADGSGYGACVGEVIPLAEVCGNGLDDDCDGQKDEGCTLCPSQTLSVPTANGGTCTGTLPATYGPASASSYAGNPGMTGPGCGVGNVQGGHTGTLTGGTYGTCYYYCDVTALCTAEGTWSNIDYTW